MSFVVVQTEKPKVMVQRPTQLIEIKLKFG